MVPIMFPVIDKLPDNVSMCDYYKDKVSSRHEGKKKFKYIQALHDGRAFYIPITTAVWKAFGLKDKINEVGDGGYDVDFIIGNALSEIVGAIQQLKPHHQGHQIGQLGTDLGNADSMHSLFDFCILRHLWTPDGFPDDYPSV